jgi:hypothetical protein
MANKKLFVIKRDGSTHVCVDIKGKPRTVLLMKYENRLIIGCENG